MNVAPQIVVATGNSHKSDEIQKILGNDYEVKDLSHFPEIEPAEETGATFYENSKIKALGLSEFVDGIVLSDDSGLEVDVLDGEPGVYSARYGGTNASDLENRVLLQKNLRNIDTDKQDGWRARFCCVMTICENQRVIGQFKGVVEGRMISSDRGQAGFGYDPMFIPDGYDQTFGELSSEIKNELSHRARAMELVVMALNNLK